jgi:hypothetical protein
MDIDGAIARYIALRDAVEEKQRECRAAVEVYEDGMTRIETALLAHMQKTGVDSVASPSGCAFHARKRNVNIADKDQFLAWLKQEEAWDMLTLQANKLAVQAYREEHDALPPGINWRERLAVQVNRRSQRSR